MAEWAVPPRRAGDRLMAELVQTTMRLHLVRKVLGERHFEENH